MLRTYVEKSTDSKLQILGGKSHLDRIYKGIVFLSFPRQRARITVCMAFAVHSPVRTLERL